MRPNTTTTREEIVIRLVIELTDHGTSCSIDPMQPVLSLVRGTEAVESPRVTGIEQARDAWLAHMAARGKKPASVRQFRTVFDKAMRECGWRRPEDFTFRSVTEWLARTQAAASWSPATVRRNLAVFKGFSRYAAAAEILPRDVLTLATGPEGDGGQGARAATVDEARAIIRHALLREEADRRARSARSLYWLLLFGAGMRFAEPKGLLWSDLHLDEPIPFILWRPEAHKNRRRMEVAISMEVANALRIFREKGSENTPSEGRNAVIPEGNAGIKNGIIRRDFGFCFTNNPPPAAFRKDRDLCMIPAADRRGRGFSPHSARKFFATTLTQLGVQPRVIDVLMRHTSGVQARYVDLPLDDQAHALKGFPALLPDFPKKLLTRGGIPPDTTGAKYDRNPEPNYVPCTDPCGHASQTRRSSPSAGDAVGFVCPGSPSSDAVESSLTNQARNSGFPVW